jgi:membrane-associated phospholipid phosphatase
MRLLRETERVLIGYFAYTAALAQFLPVKESVARVTLLLNVTIIAAYFLLAYADGLRRRRFLSVLRDWFPTPLLLLGYREMGWFAPAEHFYTLEQTWVVWDRFFLYTLGVKPLLELLGSVIPSLLEVSYTLVYAIPYFSIAMLYGCGHRERVDRFLLPFAFGVLAACALFPYFPSEPPRTVFPGADFPPWLTVFRRFNWWFLGSYGIHTSVFPSAHVSGAFSAAFAMKFALPEKKWVWRLLLVLAILIGTSVVYGRYHYLADVGAGLAISFLALGLVQKMPA